ncbi:MAG TPA: hypothetical protein PLV04_01135 [Phenylobacterium sp.]|nr:hypothetical protein [Phenylobacterium sp.]HQN49920.1 hypothetical protein [Phenylobacterium sp.]HQP21239.1 hypothetical protein [Phenylobacterium sp.]
MRHPIIKAVGYTLVGLTFAGALALALVAARSGQMFLGYSARGVPVWTATTLAIFGAVGLIGMVSIVVRLLSALRGRREQKSAPRSPFT